MQHGPRKTKPGWTHVLVKDKQLDTHRGLYCHYCTSIQQYVIKYVSDLRKVGGFFPGTQVSFTNKIDHHNITEVLLKVALNTIIKTLTLSQHDCDLRKVGCVY